MVLFVYQFILLPNMAYLGSRKGGDRDGGGQEGEAGRGEGRRGNPGGGGRGKLSHPLVCHATCCGNVKIWEKVKSLSLPKYAPPSVSHTGEGSVS